MAASVKVLLLRDTLAGGSQPFAHRGYLAMSGNCCCNWGEGMYYWHLVGKEIPGILLNILQTTAQPLQ